VAEVAALLKISTTTVYRYCATGQLSFDRLPSGTHPKPGPRQRTNTRIRIHRTNFEARFPAEKKKRRPPTNLRQEAAELAKLRAIGWID
jgi:hypothetical protein